jgi:hypothetical protein
MFATKTDAQLNEEIDGKLRNLALVAQRAQRGGNDIIDV